MIPDYASINVEERAEQAVNYFKSGYNCAQAVYMAYSDLFGMDSKTAARIALRGNYWKIIIAKIFKNIICIMTISQDILYSEKHL